MILTLSNSVNGMLQFLTVVVIFIFVVGITLIATRFIANFQKGGAAAGNNIEVVETFRLTSNKYVQIIRIGEKYLAIAIGKDEVSLLTELAADEILLNVAKPGVIPDFSSILQKFKKKNPDGQDDADEKRD